MDSRLTLTLCGFESVSTINYLPEIDSRGQVREGCVLTFTTKAIRMFSIFNAPRRYPRIYAPYSEVFNFYEGRDKWVESTAGAPREAVILFALHWLHCEVYNGGFWQYFFNSTGTSCPEAVEGFSAIGMPEVASIVSRAAAKLSEPYPFDTDRRKEIVGNPQNRMDFDELEAEFYALADTDKIFRKLPNFVPFAEAFADAFEKEKGN